MTRPWVTRHDPELAEQMKALYDSYMQDVEELQEKFAETKGKSFARTAIASEEEIEEAKAEHESMFNLAEERVPPKFTKGKPKFDLIFPECLLELAKIRTAGAIVHGPHSWSRINEGDMIGAAHRHLNKIQRGMDKDEESGFYHAAHLMCQAMFLCQKHMHRLTAEVPLENKNIR